MTAFCFAMTTDWIEQIVRRFGMKLAEEEWRSGNAVGKSGGVMEFRWVAFIAVWTILSGPVFEFPRGHVPVAISEDSQEAETVISTEDAESALSGEETESIEVPE